MQDYLSRLDRAPHADAAAIAAAAARQATLTKPAGALGRLERLAIWLAGWQGSEKPRLDRIRIAIFAGNHGVAARGVSAYPADVTAQMVANYRAGGAAINQLARIAGAELHVVPIEIERPTADFTKAAAMPESELRQALAAGEAAVDGDLDLLVVGEMGIGNTTSAAALAAALFGGGGGDWVGRGTGIDAAGLQRKAATVVAGLRLHHARLGNLADPAQPLAALACLGGRELAAIAGAVLRARELRIPVILDGFVATAAAAVWARMRAGALDHCLAGHCSAEQAHARLLNQLGLQPLLDLGMRLGEGSGAAVALLVLRAAIACHNGMASFAEAGVSGG